jgi:flagellar assembly factor FliW
MDAILSAQEAAMQVDTTRFGTIEIDDDELVVFDDGLPGFRGRRTMVLLGGGEMPGGESGDGHHSLFWLQDTSDPELAFMTIVPWAAYPDYDIDIDPSEVDGAQVDDLCVLNIVTVRREDGGVRLTSNLLAPVVINTATRKGKQVILQNQDWPVQAPLAAVAPADASPSSDLSLDAAGR